MIQSRGKGLRWSGLAVAAVAAQLCGVGAGVREAAACTGGAPGFEWELETDVSATESQGIATDGLALFQASHFGELDPDDPRLYVRVVDEDGAVVPGSLRVVRTVNLGERSQATLVWKADEELAVGAKLRLTWATELEDVGAGGAGDALPSRTVQLEVVGEPTPLPVPSVTIEDWVEVGHGVGDTVSCVMESTCGGESIDVPTREARLLGVRTSWELPPIAGMVAWEAWAEPEQAQNGFALSDERQLVTRFAADGKVPTSTLAFEDDATDLCVVVVVKDLLSGEERRSEPVCGPEETPTRLVRDHDLSLCDDPPTPDALDLWCEERRSDPRCQGSGGEGGAGGEGGGPGTAGSAGDGATPAGGKQSSGEPPSDPDGGCQLAPARGGFGAVLAALAAATLLRRRRRPVT